MKYVLVPAVVIAMAAVWFMYPSERFFLLIITILMVGILLLRMLDSWYSKLTHKRSKQQDSQKEGSISSIVVPYEEWHWEGPPKH